MNRSALIQSVIRWRVAVLVAKNVVVVEQVSAREINDQVRLRQVGKVYTQVMIIWRAIRIELCVIRIRKRSAAAVTIRGTYLCFQC